MNLAYLWQKLTIYEYLSTWSSSSSCLCKYSTKLFGTGECSWLKSTIVLSSLRIPNFCSPGDDANWAKRNRFEVDKLKDLEWQISAAFFTEAILQLLRTRSDRINRDISLADGLINYHFIFLWKRNENRETHIGNGKFSWSVVEGREVEEHNSKCFVQKLGLRWRKSIWLCTMLKDWISYDKCNVIKVHVNILSCHEVLLM